MRQIILVLLLVNFGNVASAPLINGRLGQAEWLQEEAIDLGWEQGTVWVKTDSQFVYICVASSDTRHTGLDMYLDNLHGNVFMLHVSSAHGQRELVDSTWQESIWGPPELWTSNLVEMVVEKNQRVINAPEAFEFQISRQLLPSEGCKIMLHLKRPEEWIPPKADSLSTHAWPQFIFNTAKRER